MAIVQGSCDERRFFSIQTDSLLDNTSAHFDVYALVEKSKSEASPDDYILYAKAPFKWTLRELRELMTLGVRELYIDESQRSAFDRYRQMNNELPVIDRNQEARFRIQQVQDIGNHVLESCFLCEIDQPMIERVKSIAEELVACLQEDPRCVRHIQTLGDHSIYTYIHSVGVGVLTPAIAMQMGETDRERLTLLSMGGLFHDVGKKHVPLNVLDKSGPLTPEEWALMKEHPAFGLQSLDGLVLPEMVMEIVGRHHEKLDGSGYPCGLMANEIPDHVQIATVADIFSALTTMRCYHFKRSRFEALMFMKHELRGKISKEAFRGLVASLVIEESSEKM